MISFVFKRIFAFSIALLILALPLFLSSPASAIPDDMSSFKALFTAEEMLKDDDPSNDKAAIPYLKRAFEAREGGLLAEDRYRGLAAMNICIETVKSSSNEKQTKEGVEWCEKAAALGNVDAQTFLGVMHNTGTLFPKSPEKAFEFFKAAAALNHPPAQRALAEFYLEGKTVPRDVGKYKELLEAYAKGGDSRAEFLWGKDLYNGENYPEDRTKGLGLIEKARDSGSEDAREFLKELSAKGLASGN